MKKKLAVVLVLVMIAASLAGCGGKKEDEAVKTFTVARTSLPAHVDPRYFGSADCGEIINLITAGLYHKDADNIVQLDIATSEVESEDQLTITYTIGDSWYYDSEGNEYGKVVAEDFVFAWRLSVDPVINPDNQSTYLCSAGVKNAQKVYDGELPATELGVYAKDENTLVVEFDYYVPYRKDILVAGCLAPQREDFFNECGGEYGTSADTILNNGPFILKEFSVGGTSIVLVPNENFKGLYAGELGIDELVFVEIQDSQQAVLAYENGDVDFVKLLGEQVDAYQDDEAFVQYGMSSITYLAVNCVDYDNINLRNALSHGLDKQALCDDVLKDGSMPAFFIVPYGLTNDGNGNDFRETSKEFSTYDVELAQKFWDAAKAELGVDTYEVDFLITSDEAAYTVGAWVQDQYEKNLPGIKVNLVTVPYENKMDKVMNGDFGFAVVTWGADYPDATTFLECYTTGFPINVSKWSNPEYDAIIAECTTGDLVTDLPARAAALQRAEEIFFEGASVIPLYQKTACCLLRSNFSGICDYLTGVDFDYRCVKAE